MKTMIYAAGSAALSVDGVVAVARLTGLVTEKEAHQAVRDNAAWISGRTVWAAVVRLEASAYAVRDTVCVSEAVRASRRLGYRALPTAIVVSADQRAMFAAHAARMAEQGIPRSIFTCAQKAHEWAAQQAAVQEYWDGLRLGLRASA